MPIDDRTLTLDPLSEPHISKAQRHARALRRAILSYWYATIEDPDAAAIEAGNATFHVNILDEAVFGVNHGARYRKLRNRHPLGQVVMGLELIRNCETHCTSVFGGLMVGDRCIGVPTSGGLVMRSVYCWPKFEDLPQDYVKRPIDLGKPRGRARKESLDAYRREVEGRPVIETLLDSVRFFAMLDHRLTGAEPKPLRFAWAEIPDSDPALGNPSQMHIARPMGLDNFALVLPDIACHPDERRAASWPAHDRAITECVKKSKVTVPRASSREVTYRIVEDGRTVGYGGAAGLVGAGWRPFWTERTNQVYRDLRRGYRYWLAGLSGEVDLVAEEHSRFNARDDAGADLLSALPVGDSEEAMPAENTSRRLFAAERYPDLYLRQRLATEDPPTESSRVP